MLIRLLLALILSGTLFTTLGCSGERFTELMNASRDGNNSAVLRALNRGLPVNQISTKGKTALMFAASNGHLETIKLLLEKGADLNIADHYGTTAIIIGSTAGRAEVVEFLLSKGADPITKDSSGGAAIDNATFYGHTDTVNAILATNPKLESSHATELLMIASGLCKEKIVKSLLKFGVDPNISGKKQRTPLIAAVAFNKIECARLLLIHGAKKSMRDINGKTAIDIAKEKDYTEMLALLKKPES